MTSIDTTLKYTDYKNFFCSENVKEATGRGIIYMTVEEATGQNAKGNNMTLSARELSLLSNTDVLGYIQAENAKRDAQAKAEGWDFWTLMAESLADKYANVYELELMFARGAYSDTHKDWCGSRGYVSEELTLEQVEAEVAKMAEWVEAEWKAEQEWLAEQKQMERDQIALGLTDAMSCGEEVELEEWEIWEAKAEWMGF